MATISVDLSQLQMFFLILLRIVAIIMSIPGFGGRNIPLIFKVGLAISVSVILFPILEPESLPLYTEAMPFAIGVFGEIMLGVIIGFSVNLIFAGIQLAGQLTGYQMGFAIANVMDPQTGNQASIIAGLQNIAAVLLFFALNAHHWFLRSLVDSFNLIPIFDFECNSSVIKYLIKISGNMFVVAVKVAAPVMAALLLSSVCLGLLARTVPRMNVFFVGIPFKIAMGLIFIGISLPYLSSFLKEVFGELGKSILTIFNLS